MKPDLRQDLVPDDAPALGGRVLDLLIRPWRFSIAGLDDALGEALARRWRAFVEEAACGRASDLGSDGVRVEIVDGGSTPLFEARPGETYRVEGAVDRGRPVVASYRFAAVRATETPHAWRLALRDDGHEPRERIVENAIRMILSRAAVEAGGFALHSAGVLVDGTAVLFAGRSGAGKTTAVALARADASLGDDFGVVFPSGDDWLTPALPFDNRAERAAVRGRPPARVGCVLRLFRSETCSLERPGELAAVPSLLACTVAPRVHPDLAEDLIRNVDRFVGCGRFAHLRFGIRDDLRPVVERAVRALRGEENS